MGRSKADRELATTRRARAWELYCQSVPQFQIAAELGISESATSKLIKQAAAVAADAMPKSREEMAAELAARWGEAERLIRGEVERQQREGRVTTTVTTFADGTQRVEQQHTPGADPQLVKALSTHCDRRARQAMNQLAPVDTGEQQEAIRVFFHQPLTGAEWDGSQWNEPGTPTLPGPGAPPLTPEEWNRRQDLLAEQAQGVRQ